MGKTVKKADRVVTPNGAGEVHDFETHDTRRIGVRLDNNPFWYPVAYYFPHEIKNEERNQDNPQA